MKDQRPSDVDRIFLDTSVLYSAAQGKSGLDRLWSLAEDGKCVLVSSKFVVEKARRNLNPAQRRGLDACMSQIEVVREADPRLYCPVKLPRAAQVVLMAAIFSKIDYLLTGDNEHFGNLQGQTLVGVKITTARDYLQGLG